MAYAIKQLEWHLVRGLMGNKWRAAALGMEWEIPEYDTKLEQRKEVAQLEFRSAMTKFIEQAMPDAPISADDRKYFQKYKDAWEAVFGYTSFLTVMDVANGTKRAPWPIEHVMKDMGLVPKGTPIINVDDNGNVTVVSPTPKDRVVDHLIQVHAETTKQHDKASQAGQHGISPGLRERLKSIETALAIAVKDGDIVQDKSKEG